MELERLIAEHGIWFYAITFVWTFLEGETFVLCAAFLAAQGIVNAPLLFLCAWLGSFSGDQLYFWTGRHFGPRLLQRFPKWRSGVDAALSWLKRFNTGFILTFRFIYGVRNFSSFALGMSGLPWQRFFWLNLLAAGIWATCFVGVGYMFGHVFKSMLGNIARDFSLVMLGVFVMIGGGMYLLHRIQKRRMSTPPVNAATAVTPPR
jgi:membrane protein DedA with SNARE-associated domain